MLFLFALLALQVQGESSKGSFHVIMVDNSASMSATDVKPSRLHQAREEALAHVESLHPLCGTRLLSRALISLLSLHSTNTDRE